MNALDLKEPRRHHHQRRLRRRAMPPPSAMLKSGASVRAVGHRRPPASGKPRKRWVSSAPWSTHVVELTEEPSVNAATAGRSLAAHSKIDILVNNAGITGGNGKLRENNTANWRRVVDVNLVSSFRDLQGGGARAAGGLGWKGPIVNVASIAGKEGNPNASHYSGLQGRPGQSDQVARQGTRNQESGELHHPAAPQTEIFNQMSQQHIDFMLSKIAMNRFLQVDEAAALKSRGHQWTREGLHAFSTGAVFDISGSRAVH